MAIRVHLNQEKCQGHNRCVVVAPELFAADELGMAWVRGDGTVLPDQEAAAQLAADNCPEYAITITDG